MANKNAWKLLQRLTEDEIGKRPKLMFCLRLVEANPRKTDEPKEVNIARLFEENRDVLTASAERREAEKGE